jgi:hypothetical protein
MMDIFEMIEMAKKSEHGATWFSEKGPIFISTKGELIPVIMKPLLKMKEEKDEL